MLHLIMDLTRKQRAVYLYLQDYRRIHGMPPSYAEICDEFGFSSLNSARKHLQQLERKGYITTPWSSQKRALEILQKDPEPKAIFLSVLGTVAAGQPLEAPEGADSIEIPEAMLHHGEHFGLRVRGDSMVEDGIHDGDVLVVQRAEKASAGQTVVALVEGEATVKKFFPKGAEVELRPANERLSSIFAAASSIQVRGIVIGLFRRFRQPL